uniref:Uncharacterized protein n=1 Tax=Anguilla anguilla TaxID=7936 RepID=A0A0E9Q7H8_ANGAN
MQRRLRSRHYMYCIVFKVRKKKVLHFRDVNFYFFSQNREGKYNDFSDCKLLHSCTLLNLTFKFVINVYNFY